MTEAASRIGRSAISPFPFARTPVFLIPMKLLSNLRQVGKMAIAASLAIALLAFGASCAHNEGPKPPRERISQLPQNLPQSWEGQSQLGGMPTSY